MWKWVVLWSLWAAGLMRQPTTPVLVTNGWLRGSVAPTGTYVEYLGIPYASVMMRFQAPGPEPMWHEIYEAIEENNQCHHNIISSHVGTTDCLKLNVYTPLNISPNNKLPVIIFIHGGSFRSGSGSAFIYGPEYLTRKDIILVTINYRLDILGFLCLGIKEAPGNAGMKDQVAAMRWVQRNIKAFGGDPDNVTIMGESAGAASVSYHILSKMSSGLFHKAILQSGSSLSPWAFQYDPTEMARSFAKSLGHNINDAKELYEMFKSKPVNKLFTKIPREKGNIMFSEIKFMPCVEKEFNDVEAFITEAPHTILFRGEFNKVPIIIGSNTIEALWFVNKRENISDIVMEKTIPNNLILSSNQKQVLLNQINKVYFNNEDMSKLDNFNKSKSFSKFYSHLHFNFPVLEETELLTKSNDKPVYSYWFNYDGWMNVIKMTVTGDFKMVHGATHGDEMGYLFKARLVPPIAEKKMIDRMTTMWTNFAKFGNPTPVIDDMIPIKWPVVDANYPQAMFIDHYLSLKPMWYDQDILYWKQIYKEYRRKL